MGQPIQRYSYLCLLAGFGSAAAIQIIVACLGVVLDKNLHCPVPVVCLFSDPVSRAIWLFMLLPSPPEWLWVRLAVPPLILALAIRRLLSFRSTRSLAFPQSFSGFPFGLTVAGAALVVYGLSGGSPLDLFKNEAERLTYFGIICLFAAFLITELSSMTRAKTPTAGDPVASRRWPIWGLFSVVLPLSVVLSIFIPRAPGGGGPEGLGMMMIAFFPVLIGFGLGIIATLVALLRKERWIALQIAAFVMNFGIGLPLVLPIAIDMVHRS